MSQAQSQTILLVDDEAPILKATQLMLQGHGYTSVITTDNSNNVMSLLTSRPVSVVVLDLFMPGLSGQELLSLIVSSYPQISVIVMTALDETMSAVECMRAGAIDYLVKPVESSRLVAAVSKALEVNALASEVSSLKDYLLTDRLVNPEVFQTIITQDKRMRSIFQYIEVIAPSRQPVLITGETGVGKDLLAKAIHTVCKCKGEFVAVNVAGLDDSMFSDTLFGHKKGAFTGADQAREGLIARAAGGTIFLDEIGDLSDSSQIKLLRLLQEHEYYPVGSDIPRKSDARVVVATNKTLKNQMAQGMFRHDLYYRLCTHQIDVPSLRERPEDIPILVEHLTAKAAKSLGREIPACAPEIHSIVSGYDFPGNIRELEAIIFDAVARATTGVMDKECLRMIDCSDTMMTCDDSTPEDEAVVEILRASFGQFPTMYQMENYLIKVALKESNDNQGAAAAMLGIARQTLNKRIGEMKKAGDI